MVGINNKTSQYSTKIILAYTLLFDFIDFETVLVRLYAFYCFFSFLSDTNDKNSTKAKLFKEKPKKNNL